MESYSIAHSEPSFRDVYDSKARGYRYSRYAYSSEIRISCPQQKSLVLLALLLLIGKT